MITQITPKTKSAMSVKSPLIHLWFPNIFQFKGGIQTYSAFLLEALQSLEPDINY